MATAQQLTDLFTSLTAAGAAAQQANVTQTGQDTAQAALDGATVANTAQQKALKDALADVATKQAAAGF